MLPEELVKVRFGGGSEVYKLVDGVKGKTPLDMLRLQSVERLPVVVVAHHDNLLPKQIAPDELCRIGDTPVLL